MFETWLVQRLIPPPESDRHFKVHQVFGNAMVGLSEDAWMALRHVFMLDYMGSAEFEFRTVPKMLKELYEDRENLRAFEFVLPAKFIEPNWNRGRTVRTKRGSVKKKQPVHPPVEAQTVYVLCRAGHVDGVLERIRRLAGNKIKLKEGSRFSAALDPVGECYNRVCGWLELDNGFFFFLNKEMWRQTSLLLTDKDPVDPPAPPT